MESCQNWFYICLSLIGLVLFLVAMFMNYNLTLGSRTAKLEKKNGKELRRIEEVEKKEETDREQINELKAEIEKLKEKQRQNTSQV